MAPLCDRPTHLLMREILFEGLRVKDERLNALAIELCGRFDEEPVRRLVREASCRKNGRAHRLRALRAVARIGSVTDPSNFIDLFALTMDKSAEVRSAAARTIRGLRPCYPVPVVEPQGVASHGG